MYYQVITLPFRFQHIEYLAALAVLPLLWVLYRQVLAWKRRTVHKIGDEKLVGSLIGSYSPLRFRWKFIVALIALGLLVLGLANWQKPGQMDNVQRKGVDVMIALDVSKSMLAEDVKPNRLERARELLYRLMDELQNDRIGLVLFAGKAYMQMPLTTDHAAARMFVQTASPDVVPTQGTVISDALRMCYAGFGKQDRKFKTIVLITDGEDHDPEAPELAKQLAANGVIINCIGIGSAAGSPITDPATGTYKKDELGQTVISKLNEKELQDLAAATQGVYIHYTDAATAVNGITARLGNIEGSQIDDNAFRDYRSYFQWFLALSLLLLFLEIFMPEKKGAWL